MSKRRRVGDAPHAHGERNVYDQWQQTYGGVGAAAGGAQQHSYGDQGTSTYGAGQQSEHSMSLGTPAAQHPQWHQTHGSSSEGLIAPYQDFGSFQQPYYYGQTDPSVYNSPWPPQQGSQSGRPSPTPFSMAQSQTIPYVPSQPSLCPSQPSIEGSETFESSGTPGYATLQDYNASSLGYGQHGMQMVPQQQSRRSNPATYFDDASMHLKMQSLPILDNLVRLKRK